MKTNNYIKKNVFWRSLCSLLLMLGLWTTSSFGQGVVTISSSGSWTVPAGVASARVILWGGGGAGAGSNTAPSCFNNGGGGGGGACVSANFAVSTGQVYNATIGAGGVGNSTSGAAGGNGGTTTFTGTSGTWTAGGGNGAPGTVSTTGSTNAGGTGSGTGSGPGAIIFAGGNGSSANNGTCGGSVAGSGGGGGGSGGSGFTPPNTCSGSGGAGGIGAYTGGAGGYNSQCGVAGGNQSGTAGAVRGGGGSGVQNWSPITATGGNGGAGQVTIIFYCAPASNNGGSIGDAMTLIQVAGINYSTSTQTPAPGYLDLTNIVGSANQGSTNAFTINEQDGSDAARIWIDFNDNGSFEDAGELLATTGIGSTVTGSIVIPNTAPVGLHRMRIRNSYNPSNAISSVLSCTTGITYGESKDFMINITVPSCSTPTVTISPTSSTICGGQSATLTASGATSYTWLPTTGLNTSTAGTVVASPSVTTTYTVTGTVAGGCSNTATSTVVVNTAPSVTATATPPTVCTGGSSQLNAVVSSSRVYHIPLGQLINVPSDCGGGSHYNGCSGDIGFSWTDIGSGSVTSISISFGIGVDCNGSGVVHTTTLNGNSAPSFTPPGNFCSCGFINTPITVNPSSGYNVGGTNTFMMTSGGTCFGFINGAALGADYATVTVNYAAASPTYSWTPSTFLNSTTIANPVASNVTSSQTYTVTVTSGGCSGSASVTLSAGTAVSVSASASPSVVCAGNSSNLTAVASGGGAPYTYLWAPGATLNTTVGANVVATPTAATTTYTVQVTDNCGQVATSTVTLTRPNPQPTVTPSSSTICAGSSVTLTASGAASSYSWSPATGLNTTSGATVIASPSSTTTYVVTGSLSGCTANQSVTVTVNAVPNISSVTANPASVCTGGCSTLSATVTSPATAAAYTFSQSNGTYTPISGGTQVAIGAGWDDNSGSNLGIPLGFTFNYLGTNYTTFSLNYNGFITLGGALTQGYCPTNDASNPAIFGYATDLHGAVAGSEIRYQVLGSSPNQKLVVQWTSVMHYSGNPSDNWTFQIVLNQTSNTAQVIWGSTSTVTTNTTNNCSDINGEGGAVGIVGAAGLSDANLRVVSPGSNTWATSTAAFTVSSTNIAGMNTATVPASGLTFTWTPPVSNYNFSWNPGTFLNTTTGSTVVACGVNATTTYTVTVSNGSCSSTGSTTVTAGTPLAVAPTSSTTTTIVYSQTFPAGASPSGAQIAAWQSFRASLTPQAYTKVTIRGSMDPVGVFTTDATVVANIAAAMRTATPFSVSSNGRIWNVGIGCGPAGSVELNANTVATVCFCDNPGYCVRPEIASANWGGINGATCGAATQLLEVIFEVGSSGTPCAGAANFQLHANPTGGGVPYSYSWAPTAGLSSSTIENPVASPSASTTYTVTVTDNCGAQSSGTLTLNVLPAPPVAVSPTNANFCIGGGGATLTATGATTYSWAPATGLNTTTGSTVIANPSVPTTYTVTGSDGTCSASATATVTPVAPPVISSTDANPAFILVGGSSTLTATIAGPSNYCNPTMFATNPCNFINSVTTSGGISNITSPVDAGYNGTGVTYFGSTSISQNAGSPITLTVQAQGNCVNFSFFSVWIDWNQNGTFDAAELMVNNVNGNNNVTNFTINVPPTALDGTTRMRIICWGSGAPPGPCDNLSAFFGETEDYPFTVVGGVSNALTYSWSPSTFLTSTSTNPTVAANVTASTILYTVTVTNSSGCFDTDTVRVTTGSMVYDNTVVTQVTTPTCVSPGALSVPILEMAVTVDGIAGTINMDGFQVDLGGTGLPTWVSNARIYYTGTSNVFATTTQYAITTNAGNTFGYSSWFMGNNSFPIGALAGAPVTVVYHIPASQLVNVPSNCGNSPYNGCSGNTGFTWTDSGANGTPTSIQIQFGQGVECHGNGTVHTTSVNGNTSPSYTVTASNCSCTIFNAPVISINASTAGYNVGGVNTFLIGNVFTCLGFSDQTGTLGSDFATVTVTYPGGVQATTTHHFWLAYDVYSGAAACGGVLDGQISMVQTDNDNIEDDITGQMPVAGATAISIATNNAPCGSAVSPCAGTLLTWDRACGYTGNYDVYLDGVLIASNISNTYAVTPPLIGGMTYTWSLQNAGSTYTAGCNACTFQTDPNLTPAASLDPITGPSSGTCGDVLTYCTGNFNATIQWQASLDNVNFFDLTGFTSACAAIPANNGPGTFYVRAYAVAGGTCTTDTAFSNVLTVLINPPTCSATASNNNICLGECSTLSATGPAPYMWSTGETTQSIVVCPSFTTTYSVTAGSIPSLTYSYQVGTAAFSPQSCPSNAGPVGDDAVMGNLSIGFTFTYFGINYTQFGLSTNGNIQLGDGSGSTNNPPYSASFSPTNLPANGTPDNTIGAPWVDLNTGNGGNITWGVSGSAPNRVLIICYNGVGYFNGGGSLTSQIVLHETSNLIHVYVTSTGGNTTSNRVLGVENSDGTAGVMPTGRDLGTWSATNEGWVFVPIPPAAACNCTSSVTVNIDGPIMAAPFVSPDGNQCPGTTRILDCGLISSLPASGNYAISSEAFAMQSCPSNSATLNPTDIYPGGDEGVTSALPIGFSFTYFGVTYTQFAYASNGHIQLGDGSGSANNPIYTTAFGAQNLPSTADPNNTIGGVMADLDQSVGGTITYGTIGSAPNRKLIVCYTDVPYFGSGQTTTFQIVLNETSNTVEVIIDHTSASADFQVTGIENADGTQGAMPSGRGPGFWNAMNEAWVFTPPTTPTFNYSGPLTYSWAPGGGTDCQFTVNPTTTTTYTVTISDGQCSGSFSTTVFVDPMGPISGTASSICSGSSVTLTSSGAPTSTVVYHIPLSQLVNVPSSCGGGSFYNGCSGDIGFNWMDTGAGSVTGISISFGVGVDCNGSGTVHTTTLNGNGGPSFTPSGNFCSCSFIDNPQSLSPSVSGYNVGGSNTFMMSSGNTCFGFINGGSLGADYATVTVTYLSVLWSTGETTSSITVSPTTTTTYSVDMVGGSCPQTYTVNVSGPNAAPTASPSGGQCPGTVFTLDAGPITGVLNGPVTYSWSPAISCSNTDCSSGTVSPAMSTTYTLTVSDGVCSQSYTLPVMVWDSPTVTASNSGPICSGAIVSLTATANSSAPSSGGNYSVSSIAYAPVSGSGAVVTSGDDNESGTITLPFNFNYYGTNYNQVFVYTNGMIQIGINSFQNGFNISSPVPNGTVPNMIAGVWNDLLDNTGSITTFTTGTAPNRIFVVQNQSHFYSSGTEAGVVNYQILLYETTNVVEIHYGEVTGGPASDNAVMVSGIQNSDGSLGTGTPGRNGGAWSIPSSTHEAWRFSPPLSITGYNWQPGGATTATTTDSPSSTSTYTVTVTDSHGCTASATTTVDVILPTIVCPADITVCTDAGQCSAATANLGTPTLGSQPCGHSAAPSTNGPFSLGDNFVTWTVTDQFGNTATCVQKVTVTDCEAPVPSCPAEITLDCVSPNTDPSNTGTATATDNCAMGTITYSDVITADNCQANYTIHRTWTATDAAGNSASCVQLIHIVDSTPPVISGFCFDQTLECPDSPVFCTLSATDNCSTYTLNFVDAQTPTCGGSYIATRTWTATDACGNVSTQVQTITVEDLTAPVITGVGPTMVILCPDTPVFSTPVATDECASADLTYFDDIMTFCSGSYIVTRYWTATDGCGNTSSDFQQIIVLDFAAPVISGVDADASIECPQTPVWSNPTAVDGCSNAYLTYDDQTTTFCGGTYTTTRTWTATDDCNNQSQASQTITVTDNTAPVITGVNASSTIECPGAPVFSTPAATDACSSSSLNFTDVTTAGCGGSYSTTRTWTATDECGNVSTASETITVEDVTAPVITGVGADQTIECPQAPVFSTPSQSDECSASGMSFTDVTTNGCGGSYTTTRTWTATDACGNHSSASQSIHVEDHTGPVISGVGANQVLECPATITFSTPTQSDACSASNMTFATVTTPGCGTTYSQTRTWTATDACGNVTTASQTISIQDHTAPVISGVLPTQTINCPATPNFCTPVATDACNSVVVTYNDVNVAACGGTYSRTRTWTAVDACGNVTTASQTINVVDHTAPVISGISPALITIQCPATPVFGSAIATDGCSGAGMTLTFSDATTTLCGGAYSRVRTWTATDGCGNVSHGSQTVNVIDNTAPVITSVQANATIQCPATPVWTAPTATDACGTATIGSSDATTTICGGSYIRTRTWTATDGCGNHSSVSRTTTVQDLTAPVIAGVGANATINCPATPVFSNPVATDACSSVTLAFNDVTTTICGGSYSKTRTWTATDACGNHSSASQTITVQDVTAPVITGVGSASTIQCPASPAFSSPTATDGCGTATLTFNDVTTNGCGGSYTRTRTWTATDGCGNHSSASQTITVVDNTAPVITGVGANTTIDCPASPAFSSPVSTDACGSSTLTFADVTTTGICPGNYVTTRTWTATDGCGNHSSASQTITVHDVTAPVITCPATIYLCASDLSPALTNATATDGCSSVAISHTACPSNFPTGTTPITWTATDLCGNTASCVQNVVRNSAITVSIAASGAISGYCQGSNAVTLTATGAGGTGTLSYLWSTGATSQSIFVNVTGSYTCTVTDQFGHPCSASATYVFQTNSSSDLSSYTIIGRDKVHLHGYNVVQNGGIGATTVTGSASSGHQGWVKVHDHSSMNALTTFARAASIEVDGTSLVMNQILSAANPTLPAFDNGLPPNTTNVNVPAFTTVTLNATTYGDITVGAGATLIFGHATVDLKNLYVAHDATVQFAQACTRLRMSSQLDLDRNVVFNPDADGKDVAVYLKHINNEGSGHGSANYSFGYGSGGGALTSVNVEYGASVKAFIYAPNGKIDVHGGASGSTATNGNTSSAFSSTATTTMKGLFIARSVKAHGRTNWNWNTVCSSCNYALRETEGDAASSLKSEELTSGLLIENFPDPFQDKTTIRFVMDKDTHATVNVYDLNGKFITTVFSGDVTAKKEYKLEFDGSGLSNGMYIYKVITADDVHTGKMLLIKE